MVQVLKCSLDGCLTKNKMVILVNHKDTKDTNNTKASCIFVPLCLRGLRPYFLRTATSKNTQPKMKNNPPNGVIGYTNEGTVLFIALNEESKYSEPEKNTMPAIKEKPA